MGESWPAWSFASAFARKVAWIEKSSFLPLREEYFDVQNELAKVFRRLTEHGLKLELTQATKEFLIEKGYKNVFNVEGGILAWAEKIDPSMPTY